MSKELHKQKILSYKSTQDNYLHAIFMIGGGCADYRPLTPDHKNGPWVYVLNGYLLEWCFAILECCIVFIYGPHCI